MTATVTCPHGMPSVGACLTCMEDGNMPPPPPKPTPSFLAAFNAHFDGDCAGCDITITRGQRICMWDLAGRRIYTHERCEP